MYLDLSVISTALWFPYTLFPLCLWYYTCLTCFGAFSFLSFVSFSSLISHNVSLSFHSQRSRFTFCSLNSWIRSSQKALRAFCLLLDPAFLAISCHRFVPFVPPFPEVLAARERPHSRHAIWSWNARETWYWSLKRKLDCTLMCKPGKNRLITCPINIKIERPGNDRDYCSLPCLRGTI